MGWGTSFDNFNTLLQQAKKDIELPNNLIERTNKIPTHDPYTNPGAFLYYECECGQVLDPKVKSFASLNNHASDSGWKIRWGAYHYIPYCPKCAKEKEIE